MTEWDSLPPDLKSRGWSIQQQIYEYVDFDDLNGLLRTLQTLAKVHGDPDRLSAGEDILRREVKSALIQARDDLEEGLDGFHRNQAWSGTAANAFFDYSGRLVKAVDAVSESPTKIADAIQDYRTALNQLWQSILMKTSEVLSDIVDAFNQIDTGAGAMTSEEEKDEAKKKKAQTALIGFSGFAKALIKAGMSALLIAADYEQKKADVLAKLADAEEPPKGLNDIAGPSTPNEALHHTGPTGLQLPMPTGVSLSPDWSSSDVKDGRWVPKGEVKLALGPLMAFVKQLRANGAHWNKALAHQEEAFMTLTPEAFSVLGAKFYERLGAVMGRDHNLYFHSDDRLDALATLLSRVGQAYGARDEEGREQIDRAYYKTE